MTCFLAGVMLAGVCLGRRLTDLEVRDGRVYDRAAVFRFEEDRVTVPFEISRDGTPIVKVLVNGEGPFLFVLDTGASTSAFDLNLCTLLKLPELRSRTYTFAAHDMKTEQPGFGVDSLRLGTATVSNTWVSAFDADPLREALGVDIQGVLGFAHFAQCLMAIDFPNRRVVLQVGVLRPSQDPETLPLTVDRRNPKIPLGIGDGEFLFMIDTGFDGCLSVPRDLVSSLSLDHNSAQDSHAVGMTWSTSTKRARLTGPVRLGPHTISDAYVTWPEDAPGTYLVGCVVLRHFLIELDAAHGLARFSTPQPSPVAVPAVLKMQFLVDQQTGIVQIDVVEDDESAKRLGFQDGDILEAINGIPAKELSPDEIAGIMEEGDTTTLKTRRDGVTREITIE